LGIAISNPKTIRSLILLFEDCPIIPSFHYSNIPSVRCH
jgi:hypothetical protein